MAKKKKRARLRIIYNAPVTLTFSLAAVVVMVMEHCMPGFAGMFFTAPGRIGSEMGFDWTSVLDYSRLFTHVLGHQDWEHLLGNLSFILLLGPLLEERYGSAMLTVMIVITALVTGVLNVCFIPRPLLGASGIAFMMILLSSFTAISKHQIPLTFLLVLALYMGRELLVGLEAKNVSSLAHTTGGLCGSLFGFLTAHSPRKPRATKAESNTAAKNGANGGTASQDGGTRPSRAGSRGGGASPAARTNSTGTAPGASGASSVAAEKKALARGKPGNTGPGARARNPTTPPAEDKPFDIYAQEATILFGEDDG